MDDDLITKKDLLELADISYGQLYRWKRKGLIPEDWFIRKSTFTGQETFFPRAKVLTRIERIKQMKDERSLDDLADLFSPSLNSLALSVDDILERNIVTTQAMELFSQYRGGTDLFGFQELLSVFILDGLLISGDIGRDEGMLLLDVLAQGRCRFPDAPTEVCLIRKLGVFGCFITCPPGEICMDKGMKLIKKVNIPAQAEALKIKLSLQKD